jgi:hypothetical protein
MPVPSRITDMSHIAANNSPTGGEAIGSNADNYLRGIQAGIKGDLAHKGADIASAATPDIAAIQGSYHDITGTTTITGFVAGAAGTNKTLQFDSTVTLVNGSTMPLLGGADITALPGDVLDFVCEGATWRQKGWGRASGNPVFNTITGSGISGQMVATQAQMEDGSLTSVIATPGRLHFHPGAAKAWIYFTVSAGTATAQAGYNIASINRNGQGDYTITFTTAFSSASYAWTASGTDENGFPVAVFVSSSSPTQSAGSIRILTTRADNASAADAHSTRGVSVVFFGDQA